MVAMMSCLFFALPPPTVDAHHFPSSHASSVSVCRDVRSARAPPPAVFAVSQVLPSRYYCRSIDRR